jgi:hypothetical protein
MFNNKRASNDAMGNKGPKKKQQLHSTLFSDGDEILKGQKHPSFHATKWRGGVPGSS